MTRTASSIRFVATVRNVRDVALLGTADFSFWEEALREHDLRPLERDGRAPIIILAADARWMGFRFTELTISVVLGGELLRGTSEVFMAQAFNSSRFFAWVERNHFRTPYDPGSSGVDVQLPAAIRLATPGGARLELTMGSDTPRAASEDTDSDAVITAHLPGRVGSTARREFFYGRIFGRARTYAFTESDRVVIGPSEEYPVFRALQESGFRGEEWTVREASTHARSRTFARSQLTPA